MLGSQAVFRNIEGLIGDLNRAPPEFGTLLLVSQTCANGGPFSFRCGRAVVMIAAFDRETMLEIA